MAHHQRNPILAQLEFALVALTVFLSPMNYFRLENLYLTAADLTGAGAFLVMIANRQLPMKVFGVATNLWLLSFLLFVGGLMIGSLVNGSPTAGLSLFVQYAYSLILLPFILSGRPYRQTLLLSKIFVVSIVIIMMHGIYLIQFVETPDPRLVSPSGRLRSLVERENATAAIAAFAITFAAWLYIAREISLPVLAIVLAPLIYGLLLTGSNTGLIVTLFGIAGLMLLGGSLRWLLQTVLFAGATLLVLILWGEQIVPEIFRERVLSALINADIRQAGDFESRFLLMQEAIEITNRTLIFGLGADQYRLASTYGAPVHNSYLLVLAEGGLLSLIGLVGMLLAGVYLALSAMQNRQSYLAGVLTLTTVILFAIMLNAFAHFYARFWHIPLVLALALCASFQQKTTRKPGTQARYPYRPS